jgi:DNA-binding CsgD family transcriptional regulator
VRKKNLSSAIIKKIRDEVSSGKAKSLVAKDLQLSLTTVWSHTKDIHTQKVIPKKLKEKIRAEVKNGKSKYQTAKEYNLSTSTVYLIAKDLPNTPGGWPGIRGKTFDLLQELLTKGYVFAICSNPQNRYMLLHKYFPTIRRIKVYNQHILYFEGKEDVAARAFINKVHKRIISFHELKQITKVFGTDLSKKEKEAFLLRKGGKRWAKIKGIQKGGFSP